MTRRTGRDGRWRASALALLATLATLLAGCAAPILPPLPWQSRRPAPLPAAQQILHIALRAGDDAAGTFDPAQANDYVTGWAQLVSLLYSGLFTLNPQLRPVGALASAYSVSADGLRYMFHLRTDARFAEGAPITSGDVAFGLNRLMSDCLPSGRWDVFATVKDQVAFEATCRGDALPGQRVVKTLIGDSLLTPDDHTLVIVLAQPDGALIDKLAEPYSGVVEQSFVTRFGDDWTSHLADGGGQGTSGMYAVSVWKPWVSGELNQRSDASVTLRAAAGYWGRQPMLRQVIVALRQRQGDSTSLAPGGFFAIKTSDDVIFDAVPPVAFTLQVNAAGLRFFSAPARSVDALALDPQTAPLGDPRLRKALALALDKTQLAKTDDGIATNHLIPSNTGAYPAKLSGPLATAPLTGDVAQAQAFWQSYVQAKCGGVASRCPVITAFDEGQLTTTPLLAAMLARWRATLPGIRFAPVVYRGGLLITTEPAPPAVNYAPWNENDADPQDWLLSFADIPGENPYFSGSPYIHDPAADALVARAEATRDPAARLALYQQAENLLLNDAEVVPIAQGRDTWAIKPTVVNFPANPAPFIAPGAWARIYLAAPAST
jgi:peptide/nickel transport system substrate-binding protein/oligopeptide transport system substrate-binding protein